MNKELQNCWARSKHDVRVDLLHIYKSGEMFDCSFKIRSSTDADTYKVFRCHKLILSTASSVFQAMFFGDFLEAKKSPESPIDLPSTDSEAFESAMMFIYGNKKTFKEDTPLAIKVYAFAHRMQIISLMAATEGFLNTHCHSSNAMAIYDIFRSTATNTDTIEQILKSNMLEALTADCWVATSPDSVEDMLKMNELTIDELDLFKALIRWGKAQLKSDDTTGDKNESLLRNKVERFLKYIRFESMESKDAAEVCETTNIFSPEEQRLLLLATVLKDPKHLPKSLVVGQCRPARNSFLTIQIDYERRGAPKRIKMSELRFAFSVSACVVRLEEFALSKDFYNIPPYCSISLFLEFPGSDIISIAIATYITNDGLKYKLEDDMIYFRSLSSTQTYHLKVSEGDENEQAKPYSACKSAKPLNLQPSTAKNDKVTTINVTNSSLPVSNVIFKL